MRSLLDGESGEGVGLARDLSKTEEQFWNPALHWWELLFLATLIAGYVWLNTAWIEHNHGMVMDNAFVHINHLWVRLPYPFYQTDFAYPPLLEATGRAFLRLTASTPSVVHITESVSIFAALYLIGSWALGRITHGRLGGVLMALCAAGSPLVCDLHRTFLTEAAESAFVALAFVALIASRGGRRILPCTLLGVFFGLGMLSRQTFGFFFLAPMAIEMLLAWRHSDRRLRIVIPFILALLATSIIAMARLRGSQFSREESLNLQIWLIVVWLVYLLSAARLHTQTSAAGNLQRLFNVFAIGAIISGPWYLNSLFGLTHKAQQDVALQVLPSTNLYYYLYYLGNLSFGFPYLLLTGVVWALVRGPHRYIAFLSLAALVSAVLLMSFTGPFSQVRYVLSVAIYVNYLACTWLVGILRAAGRWASGSLVLFVAAISFMQVGWWLLPGISQDKFPLRPVLAWEYDREPDLVEPTLNVTRIPSCFAPYDGPPPPVVELLQRLADSMQTTPVGRYVGYGMVPRGFSQGPGLECDVENFLFWIRPYNPPFEVWLVRPDQFSTFKPQFVILTGGALCTLEQATYTYPALSEYELLGNWLVEPLGNRTIFGPGGRFLFPRFRWYLFKHKSLSEINVIPLTASFNVPATPARREGDALAIYACVRPEQRQELLTAQTNVKWGSDSQQ